MKFLCDQMLGTLARWLRLFGFDTFYANAEITDEELLEIAEKENRIFITRDKQLINKVRRKNLKVIEIKTTNLDEQLQLILNDIDIDEKKVLSRCSLCNTILINIKKDEVKNKVPEKVYENNDKFWFCKKCDKFYWMGSHHSKIVEKINNLKH